MTALFAFVTTAFRTPVRSDVPALFVRGQNVDSARLPGAPIVFTLPRGR